MERNRFALYMIVCWLFGIGGQPLFGQQPYEFTNYTTSDGLSDNRITCIYRDRTGYLWIGTENGLNRFDGHAFLTYRPGDARHYLSHAFVHSIAQDSHGDLWVATANGLNRIDAETDTTQVFLPDDTGNAEQNPRKAIPNNLIWSIYVDPEDRMWLAPDMRDLCYYDIRTKEFHYFPWLSYVKEHLPRRNGMYNSIRRIYRKSADELWLGTPAGLFSLHTRTGVFTQHPSLAVDHFIQLQTAPQGNGVYFIQHPGDSLQVLDGHTGRKTSIPYAAIPFQRSRGNDGGQRLWLPARQQLLEIHPTSGAVYRIAHEMDNPHSLVGGNLRTVYLDPTGLVWVGSDAGLSVFDASPSPFRYVPVYPGPSVVTSAEKDLYRTDHLLHTVLYSASDDCYYASSPENDCLLIVDARTGRRQVHTEIAGIPLTNCSVLHEDGGGLLWILANRRAFTYDRARKQFAVTGFRCAESSTLLTDMVDDAAGNLWIASFNDGVYRYDPVADTTHKLVDDKLDHFSLATSLCVDDQRQTLWVGTFSIGLCAYDLRTRQFRYYVRSHKPGEIGTSLVTDVVKGHDGKLWIASYAGGIIRYDPVSPSDGFTSITTAAGLPDDNVYSLVADGKGKIWGTTYYGLFALDESTNQLSVYNRNKGIGFTDFHGPIGRSRGGVLTTAVDQGFIRFAGGDVQLPSSDFTVVLQGIATGGGESRQPPSDLRLDYGNSQLEIAYAALTYRAPKLTEYEYRLDGLDTHWLRNGNTTAVRYPRLDPGSYTFRVRAVDYAGRRSTNEAVLPITVVPPWWQTWGFRLACLAALTAGGLGFYQWRIAGIKKRAAIQLQIQELKEQALRSQMKPHFIFNCLNAIQELIVTEDYTQSYQYLAKFSALMRLVLHASEKNIHSLEKEIEINRLYLELESLRFKNLFRFDIRVSPRIDAESTLFPTLLLQPFIENAIWHGLMQKEGLKHLDISFLENGEQLYCSIVDNGIGLKKAEAIRASKLGKHHAEAKGIKLAEQRLEALKLAGIGEGSIRITDKLDTDGTVIGTVVIIVLSPTEKLLL